MRAPNGSGLSGGQLLSLRVPGATLMPLNNSWWFGTGRYSQLGSGANSYQLHDTNAYINLITSDTAITVEAVPLGVSSFMSVYSNGVFNQFADFNSLPPGVSIQKTFVLPAGANKLIRIEETANIGIRRISTPTGYTVNLIRPASSALLVYGDSVTAGASAFAQNNGFAGKLRQRAIDAHTLPYTQTTSWGISGKRIADDSATPSLVAATTAEIIRRGGTAATLDIWYALGVNDWIGGSVNAATVATYLQNQLASIHAALPNARLFYSSPYGQTDEANPGGGGDTLLTFISTLVAAAAALPYVEASVNGKTQLLPGVLLVGAHPDTTQHSIIATNIVPFL